MIIDLSKTYTKNYFIPFTFVIKKCLIFFLMGFDGLIVQKMWTGWRDYLIPKIVAVPDQTLYSVADTTAIHENVTGTIIW